MKIYIGILTLILGFSLYSGAQENDPKAVKLLNEVTTSLDESKSLHMTYVMKYFIPESTPITQNGEYHKVGEKIKVSLADVDYYVANDAVYEYNKPENTITIKDKTKESIGIISPSMIIKQFVDGNYTYRIAPESTVSKTMINFKPIDRDNQYSKLRVTIDPSSKLPTSFFMSMRNGTQVILDVLQIEQNQEIASSIFSFNPKDYPQAEVEDLRF